MTEALRGRDYITTQEWSKDEIELALETAFELKARFHNNIPHRLLVDKTIFLLFFDKSTRTRNSFEAGITQLGGHAHFIDSSTSQIAHGESAKDTGIILSSYGHGIAIRHDLVPGEGNRGQLTPDQQAQMQRLAAEQQAVREALQQLQEQSGERSDILGRLDGMAKQMDEVIQDLLKQNVDRRTIERQRQILSRMLDAQKSLEQRKQSKKRKAQQAKPAVLQ